MSSTDSCSADLGSAAYAEVWHILGYRLAPVEIGVVLLLNKTVCSSVGRLGSVYMPLARDTFLWYTGDNLWVSERYGLCERYNQGTLLPKQLWLYNVPWY
jgi:hypothetical protein